MSSPSRPAGQSHSFIIRRGLVSDIEAVLELAEGEPTASHWSYAEYGTYCMSGSETGNQQVKALFVACVSKELQPASQGVIGFAAFSAITVVGECELANMAVSPDWRRHGIGSRLLATGLLWCRARCFAEAQHTGLWLEVRASNRNAIAFYESAGFIHTGTRPSYYAQPVENAILMRKALNASAEGVEISTK